MSAADWFPADEPLREHELQALRFLASNGPHQIGVIDDEDKFAAAFVFVALTHKGCVIGGINESGGPTYRLTAKGRAASRIEARRGETGTGSISEADESLTAASGDAQPPVHKKEDK